MQAHALMPAADKSLKPNPKSDQRLCAHHWHCRQRSNRRCYVLSEEGCRAVEVDLRSSCTASSSLSCDPANTVFYACTCKLKMHVITSQLLTQKLMASCRRMLVAHGHVRGSIAIRKRSNLAANAEHRIPTFTSVSSKRGN